jgi:tRNA U55 pseudouridine synthase TruB
MYVRSLARDIGAALGTAAYLAELRRVATGGFSIGQAIALEEALAAFEQGRTPALIGLNQALAEMNLIEADDTLARRLRNGDASALLGMIRIGQGPVKVVCGGALVAIAQFGPDRRPGLARVFGC